PDLPDTYEQLGQCHSRAGDNQEAAKFFKDALKRNPQMPGSLFGLAKIYMQDEKYREALRAVDAALRLAPGSQGAHFLRGQVLLRVGRREGGEAEMATAKRMVDADLSKGRDSG